MYSVIIKNRSSGNIIKDYGLMNRSELVKFLRKNYMSKNNPYHFDDEDEIEKSLDYIDLVGKNSGCVGNNEWLVIKVV